MRISEPRMWSASSTTPKPQPRAREVQLLIPPQEKDDTCRRADKAARACAECCALQPEAAEPHQHNIRRLHTTAAAPAQGCAES